jgi:hypothetical protein
VEIDSLSLVGLLLESPQLILSAAPQAFVLAKFLPHSLMEAIERQRAQGVEE